MKHWEIFSISLLLVLLAACGVSKETRPEADKNVHLTYTCTPDLSASTPYVHVTFQVRTDAKGELLLGYPDSDWGETNLSNCFTEFEVHPQALTNFQKDSNQIFVKGKPKQLLHFSYKIIQDFTGHPLSKNTYRPQVNKHFFHVFGKNLFLLPYPYFENEKDRVALEINWKLADSAFEIVNSFGMGRQQNRLCSYDNIYSSVFMGGKLTSYIEDSAGQKVVLSTPDTWEHIDIEKLNQDLNAIIRQQRDFWNDHSAKLQTVTLLKTYEACPSETECSYSLGGTGLTNSFATFSSDNPAIGNDRLNWLFAHELFHHWVGTTIQNENEVNEYWFSEGFTDYYAYKLLLRNRMMTVEEFVDKVNEEVIVPHYSSAHKDAANSEITAERFWSEQEWEKLPYRRGWLYAFYLDAQIKNLDSKNSLDDVMRAILKITQEQDVRLNADVFLQVLERYADVNFRSEFTQFIVNGEAIDLKKMSLKGIYFSDGEIPSMHLVEDLPREEIFLYLTQ